VVETPAPPVDEVVVKPVAVPAYVPMEPMSLAPAPPRYWCDFCKEYTLLPHTLEYNYSLPSPTPVPETQVTADRSIVLKYQGSSMLPKSKHIAYM
jgi:hypothetical protein